MSPASKHTISFTVDRTRSLSKLAKSGKTIAQAERDRVQRMIATVTARKSGTFQRSAPQDVAVINNTITYVAAVGIGSPPTTYALQVDTGSSNTWVGAGQAYVQTVTSVQTSNSVDESAGSSSFSGTEFMDQVTLSPELVIMQQSIGVASTVTSLENGLNGVLGVGPTGLTMGTLSPDTQSEIPTVVDNLAAQGTIPSAVLSIFFEPTGSDQAAATGELTFGGFDPSKITGEFNFVPITTTTPSSSFWGIDVSSVTYGGNILLINGAGIIDSGVTSLLLATDILKEVVTATNGVPDAATGLIQISPDDVPNLQSLIFEIGGQVYTLSPDALMFPRFLNPNIGGDPNAVFLAIGDIGQNSGNGFDIAFGYTFLQRFCVALDTANKRVGLAETPFTFATTNEV